MFQILNNGLVKDAATYEGIAIHHDCVDAIENKLGGRKLTYEDVISIYKTVSYYDLKRYTGQLFDWDGAEDLPAWMFESPLRNKQALNRIIAKLPEDVREKSNIRARAIHTLTEHMEPLPRNLAGTIATFVTGRKPYQYMPKKYPTRRPNLLGGKRKTRKTKQKRKYTRKH